jgi:uncharacterized oligopeptide transporter (OPT) family protein
MIKKLYIEIAIYIGLIFILSPIFHSDLLTNPSQRIAMAINMGAFIHQFVYTFIIYIILLVIRVIIKPFLKRKNRGD